MNQNEEDRFDYFPLETEQGLRILPEDAEIVIDREHYTLSYLNWERRRILETQFFTSEEHILLITLLQGWPSYVPYEKLYNAFLTAAATEGQQNKDMLVTDLIHLWTLLRGCQDRLHKLALEVEAIGDNGAKLSHYRPEAREVIP